MAGFEEQLLEFGQKVEKECGLILDRLAPETPPALGEALRYGLLAGGKYLRAFLVCSCASLFGVPLEKSLRVAVALEAIHAFSLIHDDLPSLDNGRMRRGRPCVHVVFGEALAILTGDALLALAFELLSEKTSGIPAETALSLSYGLASATGARGMTGGQVLDILSGQTGAEPLQIAEIEHLQALKTGALFHFAVSAGAILGDAPSSTRADLEAFGACLGVGFQIADDLLDATSSIEKIGKDVGQDHGKPTVVSVLGVARTRAKLENLGDCALGHLERFGAEADPLRETVRFIVSSGKG